MKQRRKNDKTMETNFKNYPIFKKRDGQSFKEVGSIFATSFEEAKKEFGKNISKDLDNQCDIFYLTELDGVSIEGYYDLSFGQPIYDEQAEKYENDSLNDSFIISQDSLDEGIDFWREDVYTWELREPIEEEENEE